MMEVRPLHNEQDYDWAIREIASYFEVDPVLGTTDGDRFEVLSILIKGYENKHFATSCGDPVDVLHFAIRSLGKSQTDLAAQKKKKKKKKKKKSRIRCGPADLRRT